MARKSDAHRAEMAARAERREARGIDVTVFNPDRIPAKPETTPPAARKQILKNKQRDARRKQRRLENVAATAEGRKWKG